MQKKKKDRDSGKDKKHRKSKSDEEKRRRKEREEEAVQEGWIGCIREMDRMYDEECAQRRREYQARLAGASYARWDSGTGMWVDELVTEDEGI